MTAVLARDAHPPQLLHEHDWHMPIVAVDVVGDNVAIHLTPGFVRHFSGGETVDVDEPAVVAS